MVEINNLKHDIEALSAEREALRKEVESLEAKRDDLFEGVRDAEPRESEHTTIISLSFLAFSTNTSQIACRLLILFIMLAPSQSLLLLVYIVLLS